MNRDHPPFLVSIKERFRLNHPLSIKETYHIILDLSKVPLNYEVGDCVGIYPTNHSSQVDSILHSLKANGEEWVYDREHMPFQLKDFLLRKSNLSKLTKKMASFICERIEEASKKEELIFFLENSDRSSLNSFLDQYDLSDFLLTYTPSKINIQDFCSHLSPLLPRLYSIASSMKCVGREAHLVIGLTEYEKNHIKRWGICTRYLCHTLNLETEDVFIYHHPAKEFKLSEDSFNKPIIMVGPGTGIAPFIGFMQERHLHASSKQNWLFFGERHRAYDFYYENHLNKWVNEEKLRLDLAFSRDQESKIYVQHRMLENAAEIWDWLQNGAYLFICGDATRMAKDVEQALLNIFSIQGGLSEEDAKLYLKNLKKAKRYLRDVY